MKSTGNLKMIGRRKWILRIVSLLFIGINYFVLPLNAQQLAPDSVKAYEAYNRMNYSSALSYLLPYNKHRPSRKNVFFIADCYRRIKNYTESEKWYEKAVGLKDVPSQIRFYYAESLQQNGKYLKAVKQYLLTKRKEEKEVSLVERRIYSCEQSDSIKHLPNRFKIRNALELNTSSSEFGLIPYGNGRIFISDRNKGLETEKFDEDLPNVYRWTDRGYLKLFWVKDDSTQTKRIPVLYDSLLKTPYHIGSLVFNKKQDLVFYTITRKVNPKSLTTDPDKIKKFVNRLEIYYSQKVNGRWEGGKPFPFNNVLDYSVGHPALSPDEKVLYFCSDMTGTLGGTDLFFSEIKDNLEFGKPVNAGPAINTEGNEMFPVFQPDGDLFFSSDGLPGLGGLDIFRTHGQKDAWLKPDNLGFPINSPKDDFSFLGQGKDVVGGYFSSNREGGKGSDDLYTYVQIKPLPPLKSVLGKPLKKDSLEVVNAQESYFPLDSVAYIRQYSPTIKGKYFLEDSLKRIAAAAHGLKLKERSLKMRNIGHEFNQYLLDSAALRDLDSVTLILLNNPTAHLSVIGHADSRGSKAYNLELSRKRAKEVSARLIKLGINPKRLEIKWEGSNNPKVPCSNLVPCTEEDFAKNRKTELSITGISSLISYTDGDPNSIPEQDLIKKKLINRDNQSKDAVTLNQAKSIPQQKTSTDQDLKNAQKVSDTQNKVLGSENIQPKVVALDQSSQKRDSLKTNPPRIKQKLELDTLKTVLIPIETHNNKITQSDLKILQDSLANHNDLFDAFSEMSIDTLYLTPSNALVIKETDGTIQRIFLPNAVLDGDLLIKDQIGNQWIIRRDRRIVKIKVDK